MQFQITFDDGSVVAPGAAAGAAATPAAAVDIPVSHWQEPKEEEKKEEEKKEEAMTATDISVTVWEPEVIFGHVNANNAKCVSLSTYLVWRSFSFSYLKSDIKKYQSRGPSLKNGRGLETHFRYFTRFCPLGF